MKTQNLTIEGMSCNHCVMHVTKELGKLKGLTIETVEIGKARVQVDESMINADQISKAVQDAGYKLVAIQG
ncbi:MAG TPA: heavy-metal-associated domain-containing protein [Bacteroidota bacterium]|nr:heavy-metal-associated domain-containing protein [Bacteroidota bacterium]